MDVVHLFNSLHPVVGAALAFGIGAVLIPAGQLLVRRRYGLAVLAVNNEVAGFKYAVVGVVYAVLLVFTTVVVWEDFRDAETVVRDEAAAAADLALLSYGFADGDEAIRLRAQVRAYLEAVVAHDWAALAGRTGGEASREALADLMARLAAPSAENDPLLRLAALELAMKIADHRHTRIDRAQGTVPAVLWIAVMLGGLATLGFTWFFGSPNAVAQAAMTGLLGLTVTAVIYVTVLMDHPFYGVVSVSPAAFEEALAQLRDAEPEVPETAPGQLQTWRLGGRL